jgi:Lysyl oxidase
VNVPRRASALLLGAVAGVACAALLLPAGLLAQAGAPEPTGSGGTGPTTTTTTSTMTTTTSTTTTTSVPAPTNPCALPALRLRCPDLEMSAPAEIHLDRTTLRGHLLLRGTSSVNNLGAGPIELRAHRSGGGPWKVFQAIYGRGGHAHLYRAPVRLVYKYVPGDRYGYGYVGPENYWKVQHVAAFQLWSLNAQGQPERLVRTGPKVDYCLRDLERRNPSRRSPRAAVYPACTELRNATRHVFGTSVGWSDVYPYGYPEQWIDVTGLRGRFAFVQIANPEGLWHEASVANNASETLIALPSGRILGERVGLPAP